MRSPVKLASVPSAPVCVAATDSENVLGLATIKSTL
jgi:hypothetical protein